MSVENRPQNQSVNGSEEVKFSGVETFQIVLMINRLKKKGLTHEVAADAARASVLAARKTREDKKAGKLKKSKRS